jgi:putative oxidoreductase
MVGAVIAIDEAWIASTHFPPQCVWIHFLLAVMCAGLAMLGPGAWSVDAYLFGRRRFDIGDRPRRQ